MQENAKGKAIVSLILGIASIVLPWFGFTSIVALVAGIVGIVLGVKARKVGDQSKGMATAGLVLSIIGVVLGGIMFVCTICTVCVVGTAATAAAGASELSSLG